VESRGVSLQIENRKESVVENIRKKLERDREVDTVNPPSAMTLYPRHSDVSTEVYQLDTDKPVEMLLLAKEPSDAVNEYRPESLFRNHQFDSDDPQQNDKVPDAQLPYEQYEGSKCKLMPDKSEQRYPERCTMTLGPTCNDRNPTKGKGWKRNQQGNVKSTEPMRQEIEGNASPLERAVPSSLDKEGGEKEPPDLSIGGPIG
ncbi:hypothetical protein BGZ83_005148, partial [Gryganskiella cystojenkinii]